MHAAPRGTVPYAKSQGNHTVHNSKNVLCHQQDSITTLLSGLLADRDRVQLSRVDVIDEAMHGNILLHNCRLPHNPHILPHTLLQIRKRQKRDLICGVAGAGPEV